MDYPALITAISDAHQQAQASAAGAVNRHLVLRNWLIGAHLVEFEQSGEDRAEYGAGLLKRISADLREREVPGASPDMLERMRLLYLHYPQMSERISAPLVRKLPLGEPATPGSDISAPVVRKSADRTPHPLPVEKLLELSWTHLADLVRLEDPWKRAFYENECLKGHWSKRQLQRQIGSLLYERSGLSTDKETVIERARQLAMESPGQIADLIRDPYILEFTGLIERPHYLEADLEKALLDHLQSFLLELGTGFCFEARQKRISCHDFVDNQVRLLLFVLAYNMGNFLRQAVLPRSVRHWSLTTLREKLIKIGARVVRHSRQVIFQMAEVAVPRELFRDILWAIERLRLATAPPG